MALHRLPAYRRTSDAETELMTLAEAKLHLKEDLQDADNDTRINSFVKAARQWMEIHTGRAFITQTWTMNLQDWPDGEGIIELKPNPVISVTSVKYLDSDGVQQTLEAGTDYQVVVASEPALIAEEPAASWPVLETDRLLPIEIIFVAGYGAAATDVPEPLISANKFMLGHLYAHPESVSEGNLTEVPQGSEDLLWAYRLEEA